MSLARHKDRILDHWQRLLVDANRFHHLKLPIVLHQWHQQLKDRSGGRRASKGGNYPAPRAPAGWRAEPFAPPPLGEGFAGRSAAMLRRSASMRLMTFSCDGLTAGPSVGRFTCFL